MRYEGSMRVSGRESTIPSSLVPRSQRASDAAARPKMGGRQRNSSSHPGAYSGGRQAAEPQEVPLGEANWHAARLIPTSGISGAEEQERRATSATLAVLAPVKEFGKAITSQLGAPAGTVETYVEV